MTGRSRSGLRRHRDTTGRPTVVPIHPDADEALARSLLTVQHAAYAVEAALIGDDRIPPLHETLAGLRAAPLRWLGAYLADHPGGVHLGDGLGGADLGDGLAGADLGDGLGGADLGGYLAGAIAWTEDAEVVDIDRLVVDPAAHRRGVGRALVGTVLDRAGQRRVLVATGRDNPPARTLYESFGFTPVGDQEVVEGLWLTRYAR